MPHSLLADRLIAPLRRLAAAKDPHPPSDGQLLGQFVQSHDAAAFDGLVRRHGPMVLGVCRRILADRHAADDAFQATFVVLARRAAAVTPREQVANFLYGVAYRVALKARGLLARRKAREKQVDAMPHPEVHTPDPWHDLRPVLDEELAVLPDRLRLPVVLCDLEGRTQRDVARQLKLPPATLANRLATARRALAKKLTARGITLSAGAAAAVVTANATTAVASPLAASTVKLGVAVASGGAVAGVVPANVLQLSEGVLRMMAVSKLRLVGVLTAVAAMVLGGLGVGLVQANDKPAAAKSGVGPGLTDKEFLKRTCEVLRGTAPTPAEASYFAADPDTGKRRKVILWLTEEPKADVTIVTQLDLQQTPKWSTSFIPEAVVQLERKEGLFVFDVDATPKSELRVQLQTDDLTFGDAPKANVLEYVDPLNVRSVDGRIDTDAAFLEKVMLAARGSAATRLEKEYFLADMDAKKRDKLLDLILSDKAVAKKLGPTWKAEMLNPPIKYSVVLELTRNGWADKLIGELLATKKSDEQVLEALTLAATGRLPTDTEKKLAAAMVAKQKDKTAAWTEVATTLGSTSEAKRHAEKLKPQDQVIFLNNTVRLQVESDPPKAKK